jgi:hypothetical protein
MLRTVFFVIAVSLLCSCRFIIKKAYGMHNLRVESNESITDFLKRADISSKETFYLDSAHGPDFWISGNLHSFPQIEIYNSSGELIRTLAKHECSGTFSNALSQLNIDSLKPSMVNTRTFNKQMENFTRLDGMKMKREDYSNQFAVCIYYSNAFGKLSLDDLRDWTKQLQLNKSSERISILYMNIDMHTSWHLKNKRDPRYIKLTS